MTGKKIGRRGETGRQERDQLKRTGIWPRRTAAALGGSEEHDRADGSVSVSAEQVEVSDHAVAGRSGQESSRTSEGSSGRFVKKTQLWKLTERNSATGLSS